MRTTGAEMANTPVVASARHAESAHLAIHANLGVYTYPATPARGTRIMVCQTVKGYHTYCSKPPFTYAKWAQCAVAAYTLDFISTDPHGRMTLSCPQILVAKTETVWPEQISWPAPSTYLPTLL
jgi:hypothetical protein